LKNRTARPTLIVSPIFQFSIFQFILATTDLLTNRATVDLLYAACNRLRFTRESFTALVSNTDWELVRELAVYDDGSLDGTREWLREHLSFVPVPARLVESSFGSAAALLEDFIARAAAPVLANIDNDVIVPPHWLRDSLAVLEAHPELAFLGLDAVTPPLLDFPWPRHYLPALVVTGPGLYRRDAPVPSCGWLTPSLPLFHLDRLPFEPWQSLTAAYVASDWQRAPARYDERSPLWHWYGARLPGDRAAPPYHVVILSANPVNLVHCVTSILMQEPRLDPSRIIVVDDGARAEAEALVPGVRWIEGRKPFVFARNANLGIAAAGTDVILMNDDALLRTPGGFDALATAAATRTDIGLLSAAIDGIVGNLEQLPRPGGKLRLDPGELICFIALYLRRDVYDLTGPLDERFTGYGFDDTDYSQRVRGLGFQLATFDGCVVDHGGALPSTYRERGDFPVLHEQNRALYEHVLEEEAGATGASVLAVLRVRNEARYIARVIESVLPLCERVLVLDDHSDDDTVAICRSFGSRVEVLPSPFRGLDEARDKNYLLRRAIELDPAWVLWIDGDEVLERSGPARLREAIEDDDETAAFTLKVAYVWNEEDDVRVDGIFGTMRRASLFRLRGQQVRNLRFVMYRPPNLHCGNVPHGLDGPFIDLDVRLKHYGYVSDGQRTRKYDWYTRIDPDNAREDLYRHLIGTPGAIYAPGPAVLEPWSD